MSGVDDSFVPIQDEVFEKPSTASRVLVCLKKFLLAIVAAGLLALLVFQIILISAIGEVKAIPDTTSEAIADAAAVVTPAAQ